MEPNNTAWFVLHTRTAGMYYVGIATLARACTYRDCTWQRARRPNKKQEVHVAGRQGTPPSETGKRLRAGKAGSGTGVARMVAHAIATARMAGATGKIIVRGDSAYGNSRVVRACINAGVEFSFVLIKNRLVQRAIDSIPDTAWTPVRHPGAVRDHDTGGWISDAEVAETVITAFSSTARPVTARLIVRRINDARYRDTLFPVWRYHPLFTNSTLPTTTADVVHRAHAIIETVFSDPIDGPLAHMPSGSFGANSAWVQCAAIAHNLLRAAGTLAGGPHAKARGMTLRRKIVNIPARFVRPQRAPTLHLPRTCPWPGHGFNYGATSLGSVHLWLPDPDRYTDSARTTTIVETLGRPADDARPEDPDPTIQSPTTMHHLSRWIEAKAAASTN
jgi:hypothetical protein